MMTPRQARFRADRQTQQYKDNRRRLYRLRRAAGYIKTRWGFPYCELCGQWKLVLDMSHVHEQAYTLRWMHEDIDDVMFICRYDHENVGVFEAAGYSLAQAHEMARAAHTALGR